MLMIRGVGLSVSIMAFAGYCYAQPKDLCFAFLSKADVVVQCKGQTTQVTRRGDIESFAIYSDPPTLAYSVSRTTSRTATTAWTESMSTVIDLKSSETRFVENAGDLLNTCGGIFPIGRTRGVYSNVQDLVTGHPLNVQPYLRFRCSADRKTVVGTSKDQGGDLYQGAPPQLRIAAAERFDVFQFDVSPSGSQTSYWTGDKPLCLFASPGPARCLKDHGTLADVPSVNDSGEVLVASGTGAACAYETSYNFSPASASRSNDECLGIGYWKLGLESVVIVAPIGRSPQWISPSTATLLRAWSNRTGTPGK